VVSSYGTVDDPGPLSDKSIPYSKYAVVGNPSGFTDPANATPPALCTAGALGWTPGVPSTVSVND
jgi:hypothetical protein